MAEYDRELAPFVIQSQEGVIGEWLGRYIECESKLRKAQLTIAQIKHFAEELNEVKQELKEAQENLQAEISNREAFETQNNDLRRDLSELRERNQKLSKDREEAREELLRSVAIQVEEPLDGEHDQDQEELDSR